MNKHLIRRVVALAAPDGGKTGKIRVFESQRRLLSKHSPNTENSASHTSFALPKPTWSVKDLELTKQHLPISNKELEKLAKRALLDLDQLDAKTREELRQDLGNMMHMIEQIQSLQLDENVALSEEDIYDRPRGVTSAPLRDANEREDTLETTNNLWASFLQPKTTKFGAHDYFSIETKRENPKSEWYINKCDSSSNVALMVS
ncbi:expressed unknown protein [Seminavis robusta]|uniref:Uncharacterized protein n=1 Tax=Seminavis robusta TaxID=568900 RepID=A0A9N8HRJ9_9STRA|nr:expressed unknown protein [Seminavis robusta]|eukprot:Sro1406_g269930.1 n/a (203) ;mRNA; r:21855-22463